MPTVLVTIETDWSLWWLKELQDHVDVTENYPEVLTHLYESAALYLYWRVRLECRNASQEEILTHYGEIVYGKDLVSLPRELLLQPWEALYKEVSAVLVTIHHQTPILNIEFYFQERLAKALMVHF